MLTFMRAMLSSSLYLMLAFLSGTLPWLLIVSLDACNISGMALNSPHYRALLINERRLQRSDGACEVDYLSLPVMIDFHIRILRRLAFTI